MIWNSYQTNEAYLTQRMGLAVGGGYMHLMGYNDHNGDYARLHIFDIANPESPVWVSTTMTENWCGGSLEVSADGNYLFEPENKPKNGIYNVTDKSRPFPVPGSTICGENAFNNGFDGKYLACVNDSSCISLYDVANPASPILKCEIKLPTSQPFYPYALAISGNRLAVACTEYQGIAKGLFVYSIANPSKPVLTGSNTTRSFDCVAMRNNIVYASALRTESDYSPALHIFNAAGDLSVPLNTLTDMYNFGHIFADDEILIASLDYEGVNLFSLKDRINPTFLLNFGKYSDDETEILGGRRAYKAVRSGNYVYVAYENYGVRIFDISPWL